jgi:hypothetical protein
MITMSALPPKADIRQRNCDVRFVPEAEVEEDIQSLRLLAVSSVLKLIRLQT